MFLPGAGQKGNFERNVATPVLYEATFIRRRNQNEKEYQTPEETVALKFFQLYYLCSRGRAGATAVPGRAEVGWTASTAVACDDFQK